MNPEDRQHEPASAGPETPQTRNDAGIRKTAMKTVAVVLFMGFIVGFVAVALISAMYGVLQGVREDT